MLTQIEIPQADNLDSVLEAIIAIGQGNTTDVTIAASVRSITSDRQGRYYRKAAEILGFVTNRHNSSALTPKGERLLQNPSINNPLFISSVLQTEVFQMLLQFFEIKTVVTREELRSFIEQLPGCNISDDTLRRRLSTLLSWLKKLNVLSDTVNGFTLSNLFTRDLPIVEMSDGIQFMFPSQGNLSEYNALESNSIGMGGIIQIFKNQARLDRANANHKHLVELVASRISSAGGIPKRNKYIDLSTRFNGDYIFEMKSFSPTNQRSQIRKGISQLYEYRYIQKCPQAQLVLVVENRLNTIDHWLADYLEQDRNIHLVWDGNDELYSSLRTRSALEFLELIPLD
ncbi:MAG: hypothetical protein CVU48_10025 [Candidatus Cloacimonetes bacterium HGW-Cloacimonetes-1]|nr:MAG: hypothetical protein CVU48_10025 [Candidatus Cloacimonetes bacterium HGW-Cloacimonetes-1]